MNSFKALILKKERERTIKNRHPWLFSGAIESNPDKATAGEIVRITTKEGNLLAYGFYQGDRTIAARLFHFTTTQTHIDEAFWRIRLENALKLRESAGLAGQENGFRLVFSEGDFLPGLVVDIFGDVASIQITGEGAQVVIPVLVEFLQRQLAIRHIYDGNWILGHKPEVEFIENDLRLTAHVEHGQKTGYFFDQRGNRALLKRYAKGRDVLDTFCYSGGFTANALSGEASRVTSVDVSEGAIALCKKNVGLNGFSAQHDAVVADCFDYLRQIPKDQFDLIVLDPPAFAKGAKSIDRASRGYKDINLLAMQKIKEDGLIFTFSCSQHISTDLFQKIVFGAAKDANRNVQVLHHLSQGSDHPFDICHPEGEYLKGLVVRVH